MKFFKTKIVNKLLKVLGQTNKKSEIERLFPIGIDNFTEILALNFYVEIYWTNMQQYFKLITNFKQILSLNLKF